MILDAAIEAIADAGLNPADIDGIIPPPDSSSTEEIAANLGMPEVGVLRHGPHGRRSPTAALQTAAMAITAGMADTRADHARMERLLGNSAPARRPPGATAMDLGPMVRNASATSTPPTA